MKWQINGLFLERNFHFDTFTQALDFVNKVAAIAEQSGHHPEILMHNYNQVRIQTTTHSEGKISKLDYDLALQIDTLE